MKKEEYTIERKFYDIERKLKDIDDKLLVLNDIMRVIRNEIKNMKRGEDDFLRLRQRLVGLREST